MIGRQSYRLALPAQYERLHDVFPVQMIETYHARKGQPALPMPELEDDTDEYEVEEVKDRVQKNGEIRYPSSNGEDGRQSTTNGSERMIWGTT